MKTRNPTLETILDLHTTHGDFDARPIPEADLQDVLEAGAHAASASNMQSYSIVVLKDRTAMKDICGYQASVLLLYCVDTNRFSDLAKHLGCAFAMDPAWMATTGAVDAALAAQTACIAARSLGIDSLFTNGIHRGDPERVFKALDLPDRNCMPLIALLLGYATTPAAARKGRLDAMGVVHRDRYRRLSHSDLEALVDKYDDPHMGLKPDFRATGHTHYLEWLFKSRKPFDAEKNPPTAVTESLRRHGFLHDGGTKAS